MLTKLQNFMLLLSFAFLTKLFYIIFCIFFSMSIDIFKNYNILFFIQNSFYPLAIVLGCINLIYTPFSSYLYQKVCNICQISVGIYYFQEEYSHLKNFQMINICFCQFLLAGLLPLYATRTNVGNKRFFQVFF